jgi:hypothetical protein
MTWKTLSAAPAATLLALLGAWRPCGAAPIEAAATAGPQGTYRQTQSARALRNDDVVAMTRAKLGEDLIVLAIERSATLFTTTPEALVALKSQGVGDAVIAAMLKAAGGVAGEAARTASYLDLQPGVRLSRDACPLRLQKAAYKIDNPTAWRAMIPGQRLTSTQVFPGPRAAIRVATATPTFEVRAPVNLQLGGSILLFRLDAGAGQRELERQPERQEERSWAGGARSQPRNDPIRLSIEAAPADEAAEHGMALYRVRPQSALAPGEYVLVLGMVPDYYDFAVDP